MELIDALAHQLNLDPVKAQALAGGVLGVVQNALADRAGPASVQQLEAAVPELPAWKQAAETQMGADAPGASEGGLGGLLGSALGSLGGSLGGTVGAVALLAPMLGKLGISEEQVRVVIPLISRFLEQRLDGPVFDQVKELLPISRDDEGGMGILGGLLS